LTELQVNVKLIHVSWDSSVSDLSKYGLDDLALIRVSDRGLPLVTTCRLPLLTSGYRAGRGQSGLSVKLTVYLRWISRLRTRGALPSTLMTRWLGTGTNLPFAFIYFVRRAWVAQSV